MFVDIEIAEKVLWKLAKEDGDLGAEYWTSILQLLRESHANAVAIANFRIELAALRAEIASLKNRPPLSGI